MMCQTGYSKFFLRTGLLCLLMFSFQSAWASQPNIVLSRALHFNAPDGQAITLEPGKYFVEPAGDSELRLKRDGQQVQIVLQAEALTHEQYELFSPMAMTRPSKEGKFFITLLLPGGQKLEAVGSTKALTPSTSPAPAIAPDAAPSISPPSTVTEISTPPVQASIIREEPSSKLALPALAYHAPSTAGPEQQAHHLSMLQDDSHTLYVYAPNHVGQTIHEQPRLFWYLSEPTEHPIDVMLTEQGEVEVVFDMRLLPPMNAGIHSVSLGDYGIRLLEDVAYQWEVKLLTDTPQESMKAYGFIKRVENASSLPTTLNQQSPSPDAPRLYAHSGLWYDAFWALSELVRSDPEDQTFLEQRAALLTQVGLGRLANRDRTTMAAQ